MKIIHPKILRVQKKEQNKEYNTLNVTTSHGMIEMRLYSGNTSKAAIFIGGIGGGFDSPAKELYPKLSLAIAQEGVTGLRIKFRSSTNLEEAVHDILAGVEVLKQHNIKSICLVGHSFGGAVAIIVGTVCPIVSSIVTLATQSYGAEGIARFSPRPILFIHGTQDEILTSSSSVWLYHKAHEPKKIILFERTGHLLNEAANEIFTLLKDWILSSH